MNDLRRAIAHAAATFGLNHEDASLLPVIVVCRLYEEKQRREEREREAARLEDDADDRPTRD